MAANLDLTTSPTSPPHLAAKADQSTTSSALSSAIAFLQPTMPAPFAAIRALFDHLCINPSSASALNDIYPTRGIFKTAAIDNPTADQKLTIDLSPACARLIPGERRASLSAHGLEEILSFFSTIVAAHVPIILSALSEIANFNFRLCDYTSITAAPLSDNGCGAHTDYDGKAGLEVEDEATPGRWIALPGDATIVLCGWCALILTGGRVRAVRHRVRRMAGVRRLSAVLFVAPDVDVVLKPLKSDEGSKAFSEKITSGDVNVGWFKEVMGKRWRWREGNEMLGDGESNEIGPDEDVERLDQSPSEHNSPDEDELKAARPSADQPHPILIAGDLRPIVS
ncbi:hypothetical protein GJ744_002585 [Endocarpon pusillum]|uniref:Isopenicillin N synthase-like Fe(2+) 2OG dioxygenase domain-containing protein n=1 Tax=Endocarpon pusillum TaxID=364733 RepID=A0A8H7AAL4_9EURO|nr:hypothetical protein GJ744_002585 [Endocarpon pusillum]